MNSLSRLRSNLLYLRSKKWARIVFYFFLLTVSQLAVSSDLRKKIKLLFTKTPHNSQINNSKEPPYAKKASNYFSALFLGHLADIEPWKKGPGLMYKILNERFKWYKLSTGEILDTVRVKLFYDDYIFSKDIEIVKAFHGKEDKLFRNSDTIRRAWGTLFPNSMTVRTGEKWKKVRRVFVSAMNKIDFTNLPSSTHEVLKGGFHKYLESIEECEGMGGQEVYLWDMFARVTFDSFHKFMYNINFNTAGGENLQVLNDLMKIASNVSDRMLVNIPILWKLPTKTNRELWNCHKRLISFVDGYIQERYLVLKKEKAQRSSEKVAGGSEKKFTNLLDALLLAKEENDENVASMRGVEAEEKVEVKKKTRKQKLTYDEVRAQLCAAMFGGFDTTSSSLSFLTVNLAKYQKCQEKLYKEIKDINLTNITKQEIDNLEYLNGFIYETLRLNAVAPVLARIPNQDVTIQGQLLREGTNVMIDHFSLGQEPKYWNNAKDLAEFKPERWFNGFQPEKGAFFPFGFGGRQCPGYKVAKLQMKTILAFLVQNYIVTPSKDPIKVVSSLGITVSRDSKVVIAKRN